MIHSDFSITNLNGYNNKILNIQNEEINNYNNNHNYNHNNNKVNLFTNKQLSLLEEIDNKNTLIQNPLIIENCDMSQNFLLNNNNLNIRNSNTNKNYDQGMFSLGLFDIANIQNSLVNKNQSLFSFDLNTIPNESINGLIPNHSNNNIINNTNNDINMNNPLLNSISKNLKINLNPEPNINYINSFFNTNKIAKNEKSPENMNLTNSNSQEIFKFQNQLVNPTNNNNCIFNNEQTNVKSLFNPGYLDINQYEMKFNLFNSFHNINNQFNLNNNQSIQNSISNIFNQKNFNFNPFINNQQITFSNVQNNNINNVNNNPQLFNNFYNNGINMNINNNNENQSFKIESNNNDN